METLFKDIRAAISSQAPEIKWIDIDEGQLIAFGENAPVDYPCVLIDFPSANYSNTSSGQIAETQINLKVAFKVYARFNNRVPDNLANNAFEHFAVLRKVMRAVATLNGDTYTQPVRVAFAKNKSSADPKIYDIRFETALYDTDFDDEPTLGTPPDVQFN